MTITVRYLKPFGVEIAEINIDAIEENIIAKLNEYLANHGVVTFRNQRIDDDQFVAFLQRFGAMMFTAGEQPVTDQPWLNIVSNVGRDRPPRSVFHTDTSYVSRPPAYTALKAVSLPTSGGETLFSNQYHAFETLPASVKERLFSVTVRHGVSGLSLGSDQQTAAWHPLFRRHPISGKTALFLSTPERCKAIQGFNFEKSQRIVRLLYKHSIRPHRLYRHRWQDGDILMWDNRCTMHRADHAAVVGDRVLHRGLVADSNGDEK
jgi:taurine dioxygenase